MFSKFFRFFIIGMFLMHFLGAFLYLQGQVQQEKDFFYSNGQEVSLTIALDKIGIFVKEGTGADKVKAYANDLQLIFDRDLSQGIYILGLQKPLTRSSLVKFIRSVVKKKPTDIVVRAGLVVTPPKAKIPMLASDEFIVEFIQGTSRKEIDKINVSNNVKIVKENPFNKNQFLLKVTETSSYDAIQMANHYFKNKLTKFSHPNFISVVEYRGTFPNDYFFENQWHHHNTGQNGGVEDADIDTPLAWDFTMGDPGIVIAIIDNGFDMTHPDLVPNFWVNPEEDLNGNGTIEPSEINGVDNGGNGFTDDFYGWDFGVCEDGTSGECGDNDPNHALNDIGFLVYSPHGTSVAGTTAARGNNERGVCGSCPFCRIMLLKYGNTRFGDALAFNYAQRMGARIINCSWGYPIGNPLTDVVNSAINNAADAGVIIFFAMSTTGRGYDEDCLVPISEADLSSKSNVVAVSASNNMDQRTPSGYGDCLDILAPSDGSSTTATLWAVTTDYQGDSGYNNEPRFSNPYCPSPEPDPSIVPDARDYTFCFGGTSFSSPLVAGIAGLILSVNPGLDRFQIQRLLQDTADKIDRGSANYNLNTGFSRPESPPAPGLPPGSTHGWGRVNAFEAVRIAAPTAIGGKGGVDIYVRDNRWDWGNTEQPSNHVFGPGATPLRHWNSVDIKIDAPPFTSLPLNSAQFNDLEHENPTAGRNNRVYVRVHNRGPLVAENVAVKLYWAVSGDSLPTLPSDFWERFPEASTLRSDWQLLGTHNISALLYSGSSVAGCPGRIDPRCDQPDASAIVQFDFSAPSITHPDPARRQVCLFAIIYSEQDPISHFSMESLDVDEISLNDNNLTRRTVWLQEVPPWEPGTDIIQPGSSIIDLDDFWPGFIYVGPIYKFPARLVDPIGWNCLVKFNCPGCGENELCNWYNFIFNFKDVNLDPEVLSIKLFDAQNQLIAKDIIVGGNKVVSFKPNKFQKGGLREKLFFTFEIGPNGTQGKRYGIPVSLKVTEKSIAPMPQQKDQYTRQK